MNIGLFGGTFDPVHRGHLAFAQEALDRYKLRRIYFVPANIPPHKQHQPLSLFVHRFAMLALATAGQKAFIPSLLEAPPEEDAAAIRTNPARSNLVRNNNNNGGQEKPNYTIDTVRRLKQSFQASDKLFLLIGMDAFADIAKWHQAEALFGECEFVVANRPGYSLADVANALPESLRPRPEVTKPFHKQAATGDLVLKGATIHLLGDLHQAASATAIRQAAAVGKPLGRFVDALVAEYLQKIGLYRAAKQSSPFDGLRRGSSGSRQVAGARNAPASPRRR
jgi:nicotinate-nucleotide adenylyltransferase